ncbi:hypothetical protein SET4581_05248 [Salmonella enterica subsp. enterica serovar Typhimurium str. ST4581]|nr:hypothetical protein SET4581_05248 [Salmonella enterica subsp. enterica serovar Typhimurium str. ST4581]
MVNNIKTSVHYFFEQVRIFDKFRGLFLFLPGTEGKVLCLNADNL